MLTLSLLLFLSAFQRAHSLKCQHNSGLLLLIVLCCAVLCCAVLCCAVLVCLSEEAHDELEDALEALFDPENAVEIVSAALLGRA